MDSPGSVWVDDRNPIYRRGLVTFLEAEGYVIAGESAALRPPPDLYGTSLLIFDLDAAGFDRASALARRGDLLLIGLVRTMPATQVRALLEAGLSAALSLGTLTPSRLLSCIQAVTEEAYGATPGPGTVFSSAPGAENRPLTRRELRVLSLLAEGDSTREIAHELSYSERTVKNIVHELRRKLDGRTRAHTVALAARRGII
jgi:DNA-binding NarL/FixJ family response regulator